MTALVSSCLSAAGIRFPGHPVPPGASAPLTIGLPRASRRRGSERRDAGRHLGFINPAIYRIGRGAQYHRAFHDVTKGNNTVKSGSVTVKGFDATRGWDPVTGWGSPDAQVLIPLLARDVTR
jgi:hypothetical protein